MVQTVARGYVVPDEVPSDTEESVVGTEWHQKAIGDLAGKLRAVAERWGTSWGVCEQIALLGLQHADGTDYDPRPDVLVLPQPLPGGHLSSIHLRRAGPPLLIVEVASDSTKGNDQGVKKAAYAAIGVREYLVFDPLGTLLSEPLLAWRLEGAAYVAWLPDEEGWWHSPSLGVAFQATQPFLTVRERDGSILAPTSELRRQLHALERELVQTEGARAAAEERLAALEEELRRLRNGGRAD